ncbi:MAG: DUF4445 domain-containing protein [Armatimonadetes bacterium]|nr:DUF4445 domain-containing protein [Armatimonadota bacterium]NIM23776.1 DUF4445 domain-containing protein [Armatimonadota bacterium]NIM67653.1 DUF4445 domain-containing protein [Armatimonadota bacterium]NIM76169.1 DUF4445 domain-containing protein [Armatimonadota bacterium]NIN05854.1 DUF4445 domain-containing protein [Armatimonadota bacterium]
MNPSAPAGPESVTISFRPDGKKIRATRGATVLEAASQAGITLQSSCGGRGACGKCRIRLISPPSAPSDAELRHFDEAELEQGWRLACQVQVETEAVVEIPPSSRMMREKISLQGLGREVEVEPGLSKIFLRLPPPSLSDQRADLARLLDSLGGDVPPPSNLSLLQDLPDRMRRQDFNVTVVLSDGEIVEAESGDTAAQLYGMAFDIGTTTIVGYLTRLLDGAEVAVSAAINPQVQFGDDVVSRISFVSTDEEGLTRLQEKVVGAVNEIIQEACREGGIDATRIYELTVVGNTCMTHLFLGIDPTSLATMPYVPVNAAPRTVEARELGIRINPRGRVHVLPNIAGFVGADAVGVIIASGLEENRGLRVAVDIGTNGEVIVAKDDRLLACSTAAGPAFEGARISQGMRAASGAIDQVTLIESGSGSMTEPRLQIHTIDDAPARGICGSGLVDAVAVLRKIGVITSTGQMLPAKSAPPSASPFLERLESKDGKLRFVLAGPEQSAGGEPICLTSRDVRELQLAKGAICAGMLILLEEISAKPEEVEELLLAGAFGSYIRRESALAIGMLPAIPPEKIRPVGNAAGLGAKLALVSGKMRRLAKEVAGRVEYVELSERAEFHQRFADAMILEPVSGARQADR